MLDGLVLFVNERLMFIVEPRRAFALLIHITEPIFLGWVHTEGFETIRPFLAPDRHLYFLTICPPLFRDQTWTTDSVTISCIFMVNLLYSVI